MAEILLVNPRRRRKSKAKRKSSRKSYRRARRAAPRVRRRKAVAAAPRRRRRVVRAVKRYRRRKENPSFRGITGSVMGGVKAGFIGALGALGLDVLYGFAKPKLPAALTSGPADYLTKALAAVLVGMVGNKVMRGRGAALTTGAMTVVIHDALKAQIAANFPGVPLGEYIASSPIVGYGANPATPLGVPTIPQPTGYQTTGMGAYLSGMEGYTASYVEGDSWT
jgi:hypothetical protein